MNSVQFIFGGTEPVVLARRGSRPRPLVCLVSAENRRTLEGQQFGPVLFAAGATPHTPGKRIPSFSGEASDSDSYHPGLRGGFRPILIADYEPWVSGGRVTLRRSFRMLNNGRSHHPST